MHLFPYKDFFLIFNHPEYVILISTKLTDQKKILSANKIRLWEKIKLHDYILYVP